MQVLTVERFVQLDPVLMHKVAIVLAMPEACVSHQPDDVCLEILG